MAQEIRPDAAPALPEAMLAMGQHMVEGQVRLFGDLARCGTPLEAGETLTRWMGQRLEECNADGVRLMEAWLRTIAWTTDLATTGFAAAAGRDDAATAPEPRASAGRARPHA